MKIFEILTLLKKEQYVEIVCDAELWYCGTVSEISFTRLAPIMYGKVVRIEISSIGALKIAVVSEQKLFKEDVNG